MSSKIVQRVTILDSNRNFTELHPAISYLDILRKTDLWDTL